MKLPDDCPFAKIPLQQLPKAERLRFDCCRAGPGSYLIDEEDPLCRSRQTEAETYRFTWRSSFDGSACVHIGRSGSSVELRSWLSRSRLAPRMQLPSLALSLDGWEKLQRALKNSDFWAVDAEDEAFGLDGARWLIEGRRGDNYHQVERWSPRGAIHDLGRLFIAFAGPPFASVKLY
jgi:hypothetical protein